MTGPASYKSKDGTGTEPAPKRYNVSNEDSKAVRLRFKFKGAFLN